MSTTSSRKSTDDQTLAEQLVGRFAVNGPRWKKWLVVSISDAGVSPARIQLLNVLRCSAEGGQKMTALSAALGVTPRNITALVDGLEHEGLVSRRPHPEDRRVTCIDLTDEGSALTERLWTTYVSDTAAVFEVLTEREQKVMLTALDKVGAELQRRLGH